MNSAHISTDTHVISYTNLSQLRFTDFLPEGAEVSGEDHYEWMNGLWRYEGIGFSWFGAPMEEPGRTACFELFADEVPPASMERIMRQVGLPIAFGMSRPQLEAALGEPFNTSSFSDDRITLEFTTSYAEAYYLSCSVLHVGGLVFFSLLREDLYRKYNV